MHLASLDISNLITLIEIVYSKLYNSKVIRKNSCFVEIAESNYITSQIIIVYPSAKLTEALTFMQPSSQTTWVHLVLYLQ